MFKYRLIKGVAAGFFSVIFFMSVANAALFTASVESVEPYDIAGFTVWLNVDSDFSYESLLKGAAVPDSWWLDSNWGDIVIEGTDRVAKFGASDFQAIFGNPLTALRSGELFSFEYEGIINSLFLVKFPNLDSVELFGDILQVKSFDATGVVFAAPVPIPSALLLFVGGLLGLVGIRRKLKK